MKTLARTGLWSLVALLGLGLAGNTWASPVQVVALSGFVFNPVAVSVVPGQVVQWTNQDAAAHTVTSDPGDPVSGGPDSDTTFPSGFGAGGTYSWTVPANAVSGTTWYYHCRFHGSAGDGSQLGAGMAGVITVSAATPPTVIAPLIKANGSTNDISINSGANLSITVQLNPGESAGSNVDWWVVALANSSWYYLNSSIQWTPFDGNLSHCHPVYQGPLFDLPETSVLNYTGLPAGSYTFWFVVDTPMDGILNLDGQFWFDSVKITAQ